MYAWIAPQDLATSCMTSDSCAQRFGATSTGSAPSSRSNASPSECARSVEITIVRAPRLAHRSAVAAATLVFPTPPLPV